MGCSRPSPRRGYGWGKGLERSWRKALDGLDAPVEAFFCGTRNHVIAPDLDSSFSLGEGGLTIRTIGSQFNLRRPWLLAGWMDSLGPFELAPELRKHLRTFPPQPAAVEVEPWQLLRPFAYGDRDVVTTVPAELVRGATVEARPHRLQVNRLVCTLDVGERRPVRITVMGPREMFAAACILRRWLGERLQCDVGWSVGDWQMGQGV